MSAIRRLKAIAMILELVVGQPHLAKILRDVAAELERDG
jgi:hypothetical protein